MSFGDRAGFASAMQELVAQSEHKSRVHLIRVFAETRAELEKLGFVSEQLNTPAEEGDPFWVYMETSELFEA